MSAFPVTPIVVTLPLEVYEALATLAAADNETVENLAASLLADVIELGPPASLHAAARLAAEVADMLADQWQQRQSEFTRLRADLVRVIALLDRLVGGA